MRSTIMAANAAPKQDNRRGIAAAPRRRFLYDFVISLGAQKGQEAM